MGRRSVIKLVNPRFTENRVPLKDTTAFFDSSEYKQAVDHATRKRSYIGLAYDENKEIAGYYVPA